MTDVKLNCVTKQYLEPFNYLLKKSIVLDSNTLSYLSECKYMINIIKNYSC